MIPPGQWGSQELYLAYLRRQGVGAAKSTLSCLFQRWAEGILRGLRGSFVATGSERLGSCLVQVFQDDTIAARNNSIIANASPHFKKIEL